MAGMMRSRQAGHPCRVAGHGSHCEVSQERAARTRAIEEWVWRDDLVAIDSPFGPGSPTITVDRRPVVYLEGPMMITRAEREYWSHRLERDVR